MESELMLRASNSDSKQPRKPITRVSLAVLVLLTGWHVFASFLWISPVTPLREVVPGDALTRYMIPWFGQSWSVFAPEPINGDYKFHVRALVQDDDGSTEVTEWVDATSVEMSMSHHNLFPPRAAGLAVHQASLFKGVWAGLSEGQKDIVELNYTEGDDWLGRMQASLNQDGSGANEDAVVRYIVQERYSIAYSTQVARSIWGDGVKQVQFSATRQNIVPFEDRHNPSATRPEVQFSPTGWRGLIVMDDQSAAAFTSTFIPAYERVYGK